MTKTQFIILAIGLLCLGICFSKMKSYNEKNHANAPVNYVPGVITQVVKHDTVFVGSKDDPQMYQVMYEYVRDSMGHSYDSIITANEVLGRKLLVAQFKLKQIEKYNNITINNKSQMKYLNGWIKRALKD